MKWHMAAWVTPILNSVAETPNDVTKILNSGSALPISVFAPQLDEVTQVSKGLRPAQFHRRLRGVSSKTSSHSLGSPDPWLELPKSAMICPEGSMVTRVTTMPAAFAAFSIFVMSAWVNAARLVV